MTFLFQSYVYVYTICDMLLVDKNVFILIDHGQKIFKPLA